MRALLVCGLVITWDSLFELYRCLTVLEETRSDYFVHYGRSNRTGGFFGDSLVLTNDAKVSTSF